MSVEIPILTAAAVAALVQFMMHVGEGIGQRVGELMMEKGVEPTVAKGYKVWKKLINHPEGKTVVEILEKKPNDEFRQRVVIEDLTLIMQRDSELHQSLEIILGGETNIQEIITDNQGIVASARQFIEGHGGTQRVIAKDSGMVINSNQEIKSQTKKLNNQPDVGKPGPLSMMMSALGGIILNPVQILQQTFTSAEPAERFYIAQLITSLGIQFIIFCGSITNLRGDLAPILAILSYFVCQPIFWFHALYCFIRGNQLRNKNIKTLSLAAAAIGPVYLIVYLSSF